MSVIVFQVTTSSRLLTEKKTLAKELGVPSASVSLLPLQEIKTEEEFTKRVRMFLNGCKDRDRCQMQYLLVQADMGFKEEEGQNLIECAR